MPRPMKDSGVEWLDEIPADWEIVSVGRLFTISAGGDAKPEYYSDVQDNAHPYPVYTNSMNKNQVYAYTSKPIYSANTITVTGRGAIGTAFYRDTPYDAIIRLLSLSPKMDLDCRFYAYWISNVIHFFTDSAAVGQLSSVQMSSYKTAYCSKDEQQRIATFLDGECARIDSVIEKTRASIVEYKKLKQAIITRAVTKGIRPARTMKDSGVEWLGEIPTDWETIKIKHLCNNEKDSFQDGDWIESPFITEDGIRYLTTGNIGDGKFKQQGNGYISEDTFAELNCKYAYPNDLVISRLNAPYGRACILPSDEDKYVLAVDIVILRTDHDKRYLCYLMQCQGYQNTVQDSAKGTTMKRISRTNLGNIPLPIPPLDEQKEIAQYLDEKTAAIDLLVEKKNQLATELERLKKSLIFEYVTGKKAVAQ